MTIKRNIIRAIVWKSVLQVALRIRPLNKAEKDRGFTKIAQAVDNQVSAIRRTQYVQPQPLKDYRCDDRK